MKKSMFLFVLAFLAVAPFTFSSCSSDDEPAVVAPAPTVKVEAGDVTASSFSFTVTAENAKKVCYTYVKEGEAAPDAATVLNNGKAIIDLKKAVEVTGLTPNTAYVVYVAVEGDGGKVLAPALNITTDKIKLNAAILNSNYSPNEFIATFTGDAYEVKLDMYSEYTGENAAWLMPGTYTVKTEGAGRISATYSSFKQGETAKAITAGTATVAMKASEGFEESVYTVDFNLTLEDGSTFVAVFEGTIPGMTVCNITFSKASRTELNGEPAGTYGIKMNDADWHFESRFDFYAGADTKELPEGTYTLSDSKKENTLGQDSNIYGYSSYTRWSTYFRDKSSGTAVVTKSGETYTIKINLASSDGRKYVGTYTGEISNMDLSN